MSARAPTGFSVHVDTSRTLLLRGELDQSTVPELERKIAKVMAPGRTLVLNMARLTFLASAGSAVLSKRRWTAANGSSFRMHPTQSAAFYGWWTGCRNQKPGCSSGWAPGDQP